MKHFMEQYTIGRKILINLIFGGIGLLNVVIASSLMKFYTDIVGLTPAVYGIIFLIFSIWNGINDPIIGYWADTRPFRKNKGKYAPLIRWSIPVIGICSVSLFFASPAWAEVTTALFLLILLILYEAAKTLLDVSFNAFKVNTFLSMKERAEVQVIGNYVVMLPVFIGGMIPVWFLTGDFGQSTLVLVFSLSVLFGLCMVFVGSLFVRESADFYHNVEITMGLKQLIKLFEELRRDKTFLLFVVAVICINAATGNYLVGYLYYMDNVLVVSGLKATIPDLLTGIVQMAIFPCIIIFIKKYGSRNVYAIGLLISVIGHVILTFPIGYYPAAITFIVILAGYSVHTALMQPVQGLVIDQIELNTGKRQPGMVMGIMMIFLLPASSIQPLILSWLLTISGYVGGVKEQSPEVVRAIRLGTGIIPAVILLIGIILLLWLPINHKRELEIQHSIEKKHGGANILH